MKDNKTYIGQKGTGTDIYTFWNNLTKKEQNKILKAFATGCLMTNIKLKFKK